MKFFIGTIFVFVLLVVNKAWCGSLPSSLKITNRTDVILLEYEHSKNFTWRIRVNTSFIDKIKYPQEECDRGNYDFCIKWGNIANLSISNFGAKCQEFQFISSDDRISLIVNADISNMHLYGGPESHTQYWPAEKMPYQEIPYVSTNDDIRSILEPYWLTSKGYYIYVHKSVPLFITMDNQKRIFSLIAKKGSPYKKNQSNTNLRFTICGLHCARMAHEHAIKNFLHVPSDIPDTRMVEHPVWTTWAKYKTNINESIVMDYANNILKNNFTNSQLEIDDKWETCYGSLTVDTKRFPDMKKMVNLLKVMGFRVTIWVHPFINVDCEPYYSEAKREGYLVKSESGSYETKWWNGFAGVIDVTNPKAADWYESRLRKLLNETNIDAFKFDAGESGFSPQVPVFYEMDDAHPENILSAYVNVASKFGGMVEVVSARGTQKHPIFTRMMDRDSNWSYNQGFASLITSLLHLNIIGYPFVLPDMIAGNLYNGEVPDADLFLRWVQANVFMPSMQFSYGPWEYNSTVVNLTKNYIDLHKKYSGLILKLMREATKSHGPVNPPIWWIDPQDEEALAIDSEFLLGSDILIAPVMTKGAKSRDIYLPKGRWRDESNPDHPIITGKKWLKNYPADQNTLPYFTRVGGTDSGIPPLNSKFSFFLTILLAFITIVWTLI